MQRLLPTAFVLCALGADALAQCEIDQLDPSTPISGLNPTAALCGDIAVLAGGMQVAVFERQPGGWTQIANFLSKGQAIFEPMYVCASADFVVTGVQESANLYGRAYVYERQNGYAQAFTLVGSNAQSLDSFGSGLAISGDTIAVGASMMVTDVVCGPGKSYIFERSGTGWVETAKFDPHGYTNTMDGYGVELDTDGETVVIGAFDDDELAPMAGAAYVYERTGAGWQETAKLFASNATADQGFGAAVSVDGDVLMVGAETAWWAAGPQQKGAVHVFERTGSGWVETQILTAADGRIGDGFGNGVSLDGERVAIGAPGVDVLSSDSTSSNEIGALYVFERKAGTWIEVTKIVAQGAPNYARFGDTVCMEENQALWAADGWGPQYGRLDSLGVGSSAFCSSTPNSTGSAAVLSAAGCDSVLGNGLTLSADHVPPGLVGVFAFSDAAGNVPFGNGLLCLGQPFQKLAPSVASTSGVLTTSVDFTTVPASVMTAGSTWYFQAIFRDPGVGLGFDSSDGLQILLQP